MWYAASEILIFLLIALVLGGFAGFAIAQTYTISLTRSKERSKASAKAAKELTAARAQISELQRQVAIGTSQEGAGRLAQRVEQERASTEDDDELPEAEAV